MNIIWTAKQISQALNVIFKSQDNFGKVHFNSQNITEGDIFIALEGGARDGHDFIYDAFNKKAGLIIVSQNIVKLPKNKIIRVKNTFIALNDLARYKRHHSKACFIGITGSSGKTTTKEILGLILKHFGKTFVSRGNFNNHIGVPINLASISDLDKFVVIEMGMSSAGEISFLTKQVMPHIGLITSVSEGHLEFFDSIQKIADAKSELFEGLDSISGVAILNRDISTYMRCIKNINVLGIKNILTFGESYFSNTRLISYSFTNSGMVKLSYSIFNKKLEIFMPSIPKHIAINFAAVFAVTHVLNINITQVVKILMTFKLSIGRGLIVKVKKNNKEYNVITDYYNANPESMKAGLKNLQRFKSTRKVAILGDMKELGKDTLKIHYSLVPYIVRSGVTNLFLVGNIISQISNYLPKNILVSYYKKTEDLIHVINRNIEGGEVILIKGSRDIGLEKIAKSLGVTNAI